MRFGQTDLLKSAGTVTVPTVALRPAEFSLSVPLAVESAADSQGCQAVTVGIPFPKGMVHHPAMLGLFDSMQEVPLQTLPLANWSDGSVKWLLLDFMLPTLHKGRTTWTLGNKTGDPGRSEAGGLRVREWSNEVVIETGPATFHLNRTVLQPFGRVVVSGVDLLDAKSSGIHLTNARGGEGTPRISNVSVEAGGPVRATVRLEGTFTGRAPLRFVARLSFFAGTGLVRLALTIHNPQRARHRGGLWDLGDPGSILFRELSLRLALAGHGEPRITLRAEPGQAPRSAPGGKVDIYQDSSGGDNWQSKNHVNRDGRVPCVFRGYRLRCAGAEEYGNRASPVLTLETSAGGICAAVPEFWQQFPKAMATDGRTLGIDLFPGQCSDLYELQGGEQKTHVVWLNFAAAGEPSPDLSWVHQPARVHAEPEWYAQSGAIAYLLPAGLDPDPRLQTLLTGVVEGANSFAARREIIDEYGWRNYGEVYADHEAAHYPGPQPVISHFNNQYDVIFGALLHYYRTGDVRWFELLDPLARHVIDIDIYHTSEDRAAYNGGLFWHTDHYRDAATCTHRTYSRANQPTGRSYGGGPCNEHNYATGLLHYYFLTGDPNAREAVISLADLVINMDDGRRTVLGILDDGPTGLASGTRQPDYHGPGRGCGNSVNALLDGFLATGTRGYLQKAENLIRRSVHPAADVAGLDLLDVENRWSYTVFLSALGRHLGLKAEAGELDFMYSYARASLLRYGCWMLDNETPYLDHPKKLDFPTETWAAQDMRKANVLRLAATHAEEPLRANLLRRATELADRSWSDLLHFESRAAARPVALMMVEGLRDACFRSVGMGPAPRPHADHDFGVPETFVPQRRRVRTQLKTFRGLARALVRMLNPTNWRKPSLPARP
jgi:hypothetical protein